MWKLFKRRNRGLSWMHHLLAKAAAGVRKYLDHASIWLQKQTSTWGKPEWYTVMVVFCAGSLLVCGWIIKGSLMAPVSLFPPEVQIRPIQHFRPEPITVEPADMLNMLLADKRYLDSLRGRDSLQFNAMIKLNPALVDSLDALIHLYQTQLK